MDRVAVSIRRLELEVYLGTRTDEVSKFGTYAGCIVLQLNLKGNDGRDGLRTVYVEADRNSSSREERGVEAYEMYLSEAIEIETLLPSGVITPALPPLVSDRVEEILERQCRDWVELRECPDEILSEFWIDLLEVLTCQK